VSLQILDTTIRDGSCAIDFQFDEDDVRTVVSGLAASGVGWIEVGHGVSIGLSYPPFTAPRVPDSRAIEIAKQCCLRAKIGAVLVPALTRVGAMEEVLANLDFVRLAPAPSMLDGCFDFLRAAKKQSKKVFLQLVKTHAYDPRTVVETVRPFVGEGLDALYVVDTTGCMIPDQVANYISTLAASFDIPLGFHGHNNLSLAIANSMAAVQAGATFVDGTLGGLGRGAGNMQLESFVSIMQSQKARCAGVSVERLFELSLGLWERFPNAARGVEPIEAYYGAHRWDSMSKDDALKEARSLAVSPFVFIKELVARATGPWITREDVARTAAALAPSGDDS
jgi:4-hydroxy 2-oxovalerate aldolase